MTRLEEDTDTYVDVLEAAARCNSEADGAVMLHAHQPDRQPRGRWLTLARADVTWRLSLFVSTLAVETRLAVTMNRHGSAMTEPLQFRLTDHLAVDTSRDI